MPYRAMIWTILTIGLALLAIGLWLHAVSPMLRAAQSAAATATSPAPSTSSQSAASRHDASQPPEKALAKLVQGVLLLSFLLVCLLLLVGFFATVREWLRDASSPHRRWFRRGKKTPYVDAWSIAGKRLKVDGDAAPPEPPDRPAER